MNRAKAIKALIAGKDIERVTGDLVLNMRWSDTHGPQILINGWEIENPGPHPGMQSDTYRETWKPRRWGPWEEVRTCDEAESAEDGERYKLMVEPLGYDQWILVIVAKDAFVLRREGNFVPVRRAR